MRNGDKKATCLTRFQLRSTLLFILPALFLAPTPGSPDTSPHSDAATCRRQYQPDNLSSACLQVCTNCHEVVPPGTPPAIYPEGDVELCQGCHARETAQTATTLLLNVIEGGGGNHPVRIFYDPESSLTKLRPDPRGPLLFLDAQGHNPRLHCSTCHDAMSDGPNLLRMSNTGSALCLACHDK